MNPYVSFQGRIAKVREGLSSDSIDAILCTDLANIFYLSGFRGSDGALLITMNDLVLLVDGRYSTQALEQSAHCKIITYQSKQKDIAEFVLSQKVKKLGFEPKSVRVDFFEDLKKSVSPSVLFPVKNWLTTLRACKDSQEIMIMNQGNQIADKTIAKIFSLIRDGITEQDIAIELEYQMKKNGAECASFPILVASGERTALPHAKPSLKKIRHGDVCFIDFGCTFYGYQTDQTLTFSVGTTPSDWVKIYQIVKDAHDLAIEKVQPGMLVSHIDAVARNYIDQHGYGKFFTHSTGHGIGIEVHEYPTLSIRSDAVLQENMVVTIEPGIYIPGQGGVRIEDCLIVKKDGPELLTTVDKTLLTL